MIQLSMKTCTAQSLRAALLWNVQLTLEGQARRYGSFRSVCRGIYFLQAPERSVCGSPDEYPDDFAPGTTESRITEARRHQTITCHDRIHGFRHRHVYLAVMNIESLFVNWSLPRTSILLAWICRGNSWRLKPLGISTSTFTTAHVFTIFLVCWVARTCNNSSSFVQTSFQHQHELWLTGAPIWYLTSFEKEESICWSNRRSLLYGGDIWLIDCKFISISLSMRTAFGHQSVGSPNHITSHGSCKG